MGIRRKRRWGGGKGIKNVVGQIKETAQDVKETVQDRVSAREDELIRRSERALVIFSEFGEDAEEQPWKWLYGTLERSAIGMGQALGASYHRVRIVTGPTATLDGLLDALEDLLADDDVLEIDMLHHGHGADGQACFADANIDWADVQSAIGALGASDRLRMFYTTSCWGYGLARAMVNAGFSCGSGAVGVNTNSVGEYGAFIKFWQTFRPFDTSVRRAFRGSGWRLTDAAAKKKDNRFAVADSNKRIYGDGSVNIRTDADD
jgi:hypothetical protein